MRTATGLVHLVPASDSGSLAGLAFWMAGFQGEHTLRFARMIGYEGSAAPEALAVRAKSDSVYVFLSGECCHTAGVRANGRLAGDTVTGRWVTDSDGWGAWGTFRLVRTATPAT